MLRVSLVQFDAFVVVTCAVQAGKRIPLLLAHLNFLVSSAAQRTRVYDSLRLPLYDYIYDYTSQARIEFGIIREWNPALCPRFASVKLDVFFSSTKFTTRF